MDYAHGYRLSFYVYPDFFLQIYTGVFTIWCFWGRWDDTVDVKNPDNQLRLVVYPIIYRVLYIPGGLPDFFHQQYHQRHVCPTRRLSDWQRRIVGSCYAFLGWRTAGARGWMKNLGPENLTGFVFFVMWSWLNPLLDLYETYGYIYIYIHIIWMDELYVCICLFIYLHWYLDIHTYIYIFARM